MFSLTAILVFIVTVLALISVHEYGHFLVARRLGVTVLRFSIGFGKPLLRWRGKDQVEYVIAILPLGGYVKLLDSRETPVSTEEAKGDFNCKPLLTRFLVVLAGPATNFLFAVVAFWFVFSLGIKQEKPEIGQVVPGSIAAVAGVTANSQIVDVDGRAVSSWQGVILALVERIGDKDTLRLATRHDNGQISKFKLSLQQWKVAGLKPDPLKSLGIVPYMPRIPATIAEVLPDGAAAAGGMKVGDTIVAINAKPIGDWLDVLRFVQAQPHQTVHLTILRQGKRQPLKIKIGAKRVSWQRTIGFLGVAPKIPEIPQHLIVEKKYPFYYAVWPALQETTYLLKFNTIVLRKMVLGRISLAGLGGPITIYETAHLAFSEGLVIYLSFLGLISVMLAFINILPIPGLDGGYFVYFAIELIRGRPLSDSAQRLGIRLGFIFLIVIMIHATLNDLLRLFS